MKIAMTVLTIVLLMPWSLIAVTVYLRLRQRRKAKGKLLGYDTGKRYIPF